MVFEDDIEKGKTSKKTLTGSKMTLQKAIEMGEFVRSFEKYRDSAS